MNIIISLNRSITQNLPKLIVMIIRMTVTSILILKQLKNYFDSYKEHIHLDYEFIEIYIS